MTVRPIARGALALYWSAYLAFELRFAWVSSIDYNDALDFLRNARRLAGDDVGYGFLHPPMASALHAPLQKLLDLVGAGAAARLQAPHLFQAALSALMLVAFYKYLRSRFTPGWSHLGAVLFSLNRLTLHYFCPVMSELPCALFLLLFLTLYEGRSPRPAWAGAALAACLLSRWNMVLFAAGLAAYELARGAPLAVVRRRLAVLAWGGALAAAACLAIYARVYAVAIPLAAKGLLVQSLLHLRALSAREPALIYIASLWLSAGAPVCLLAALGAWLGRDDDACRFNLFQLVFFIAGMVAFVGHKEPRFLYPVLPLFYWLALEGLARASAALRKARPRLAPLLAGLAIAFAARPALFEAATLLDPVYRDPLLLRTAAAARGARVFWAGEACTLVAKPRRFCPGDGGYYLYHVPSLAALDYLLGRHLIPVDLPEAARWISEGDTLIEAPERPFQMDVRVSARQGGRWVLAARLP